MSRAAVRALSPSYFALVMATGIISIDLFDARLSWASLTLLWIAGVAYAVLIVLNAWRMAAYRPEMWRDLRDPGRAFGFFTFTAGTNVLGTRLAIDGFLLPATALLVVGVVSWTVLGYLIPWAAVLSRTGERTVADANGTWFIWIVAGQSVAVLAATLQRTAGAGRDELALIAVITWAQALCLYGIVAIYVAYRLMLYEIRPDDLTPPYWVAMGAASITTVAGTQVARMSGAPAAAFAHDFAPHVSLIFWSLATWIFPALLLVGWWRHVLHRVPLRYGPGWWSMVFPLGMYAAASHGLGTAGRVPLITTIGDYEVWIAYAAWLLAFAALVTRLLLSGPRTPSIPA
ncbi:tellurite resistance protein permease [Sphaerisporangium siamense]|uniref:Tellurite resistance protein TehA-like permease n=1 Tax=Sphaerisporangium siamense TaxID=795645 RepID=A0A7W7DFP4_9ACTN|nr:tellurite resistance/C4-dicarboxylate transporter family protein [Sphaerisporangium siamense]MBB4705917.1 tellurite resistance protein TehA-like permease [Sphaerisporangium siamense]GII82688.1 tellurite resistance protein permease [Sphaerisporangium siamense]